MTQVGSQFPKITIADGTRLSRASAAFGDSAAGRAADQASSFTLQSFACESIHHRWAVVLAATVESVLRR